MKTKAKMTGEILAKIFLILLFSSHLQARGAIYTYNATLDLSSPFNVSNSGGQWNYIWIISGAPRFTLAPGDSVQGTISFAGNQALQFLGPVDTGFVNWEWTDFGSSGSTPNRTGCTMTLNGVNGPLTSPNPSISGTQSPGYSLIAGDSTISTPSTVSFTGFSYSATLLSGGGNFAPYYFTAQGAISVVPEPPVIGLLGTGIIVLLLVKRLAP